MSSYHFIKTIMTTTTSKNLVIDESTFRHLFRQSLKAMFRDRYGFKSDAALLLQESAEAFLVEMFKQGQLNCAKWERNTVLPRDLILALNNMKFDCVTLSKRVQVFKESESIMTLFKNIRNNKIVIPKSYCF